MKIKIDGTQVIRTLKGEPFKDEFGDDLTLGKVVSAILQTNQQGGKMKNFILAQDFYKKDMIEIDIADYGIVKQGIETTNQSNNIVAGQALVLLEEAKSKSEAESKAE